MKTRVLGSSAAAWLGAVCLFLIMFAATAVESSAQCSANQIQVIKGTLTPCWWQAPSEGGAPSGIEVILFHNDGMHQRYYIDATTSSSETITITSGWNGFIAVNGGGNWTFPTGSTWETHCTSINGALNPECTPHCTIPCEYCLRVCLRTLSGCKQLKVDEVNCSVTCPACS